MGPVSAARCFHHPQREASGRCTRCNRFFCRECLAEHDGRLVCGACLAARGEDAGGGKDRLRPAFMAAVGFIFLWFCWYCLGEALLLIPTSFHDGSFWSGGAER